MLKSILSIILLFSVVDLFAQNDFIAPVKSKYVYQGEKYKTSELGSIMMSDSLAYHEYQSSRLNAKWSKGFFAASAIIYITSILSTGHVIISKNRGGFGLSLVSFIAGFVTHKKAENGLEKAIKIFNLNKGSGTKVLIGETNYGVGLTLKF